MTKTPSDNQRVARWTGKGWQLILLVVLAIVGCAGLVAHWFGL